jgi:tRNA/rRNA methyltransferase
MATGEAASTATPAVVLVRPREEGNLGAVARAMANMGLERLLVVEPAAPAGAVAQAFAVGARDILEQANRVESLDAALRPFQRVVATTSTRDRRIGVPLIGPRDLPAALAAEPGLATALVFGPEVGGLNNEELARANLLVTVPCALRQPTLNLAQAVLVIAYELHAALPDGQVRAANLAPSAAAAEIEGLFADTSDLLERVGFARDTTFAEVVRDLRRLAGRAALTSREVAILRGICRRSRHALARAPGRSD